MGERPDGPVRVWAQPLILTVVSLFILGLTVDLVRVTFV